MTQPQARLHLDPDAVREHARQVDDVAAMCDEAVAGAEYIDQHSQVYGELCSDLLYGFLGTVEDSAIKELAHSRDATMHLADLVLYLGGYRQGFTRR